MYDLYNEINFNSIILLMIKNYSIEKATERFVINNSLSNLYHRENFLMGTSKNKEKVFLNLLAFTLCCCVTSFSSIIYPKA